MEEKLHQVKLNIGQQTGMGREVHKACDTEDREGCGGWGRLSRKIGVLYREAGHCRGPGHRRLKEGRLRQTAEDRVAKNIAQVDWG